MLYKVDISYIFEYFWDSNTFNFISPFEMAKSMLHGMSQNLTKGEDDICVDWYKRSPKRLNSGT